jgi:radical SAM superfamily enzyme YgiQ (UPF0313 family)
VKITIIFPGRSIETARSTGAVMPLAPCLLAALTPKEHDVSLIDMFMGDRVDYEADVDVVAITVRTPLATIAYEIADSFLQRGKQVFLGGPHTFAFPEEAKQHATAVAIGEGEDLWPQILEDIQRNDLKQFYVCGPFAVQDLPGTVHHVKQRPTLEKLPLMRRDLLPRGRYMMDSIFTTRGCPNHCRFCPVTDIFGGKIRHRSIDEVVAEVSTLGPRYYNFDDSVFGHPQMVDRPEENQYYLALYRELATLRPKRLWSGAGGLSAVNYKDGRKILELAAESGLCSVAAGLESISPQGQKQSGAWRKLHYTSPNSFEIQKMKENVRTIQSLGIEVRGFFVVGWDEDTPETYRRTLDFCDECGITPFIFTLTPMPGSQDGSFRGGLGMSTAPATLSTGIPSCPPRRCSTSMPRSCGKATAWAGSLSARSKPSDIGLPWMLSGTRFSLSWESGRPIVNSTNRPRGQAALERRRRRASLTSS